MLKNCINLQPLLTWVNHSAVVIWLAGVVCYHLCIQFLPAWGAALPTLAFTFTVARLTRAATSLAAKEV